MLRCVVGLLLVLCGCSGDGIEFEGTPGAATPASMDSWVPRVPVTVEASNSGALIVDTGSPLTVLDSDSFPTYGQGPRAVDVAAFGLTFPDLLVAVFDLFETPPAQSTVDGVLGGDVLRHFRLSVDYRGGVVWLGAPGGTDPPVGFDAATAHDPVVVDVDVEGGGLALLPGDCPGGCGTVDVPATRILVSVHLESLPEPVWMLVDTGASAVVLSAETMSLLGTAGRPRLDGVTVGTASGNTMAYLTRVGMMGLGAAEQTSVPALVLDTDLLSSVTAELGRPVAGLVGGSFLRHYMTTMSYADRELVLAPYVDSSHIDPDEYVRVGFTMRRLGDAWVVADVYDDTSADAAGLLRGDTIAEIDGTDVSALDADAVQALVDQFSLGQRVPVGVARDAGLDVLLIEVEDLLPSYGGS